MPPLHEPSKARCDTCIPLLGDIQGSNRKSTATLSWYYLLSVAYCALLKSLGLLRISIVVVRVMNPTANDNYLTYKVDTPVVVAGSKILVEQTKLSTAL